LYKKQQSANKDEFFFDTFQSFFVSLKPVQMQKHHNHIVNATPAITVFGITTITTITTL